MTYLSNLSQRAVAAVSALALSAMFMAVAIAPATYSVANAGMMA